MGGKKKFLQTSTHLKPLYLIPLCEFYQVLFKTDIGSYVKTYESQPHGRGSRCSEPAPSWITVMQFFFDQLLDIWVLGANDNRNLCFRPRLCDSGNVVASQKAGVGVWAVLCTLHCCIGT